MDWFSVRFKQMSAAMIIKLDQISSRMIFSRPLCFVRQGFIKISGVSEVKFLVFVKKALNREFLSVNLRAIVTKLLVGSSAFVCSDVR